MDTIKKILDEMDSREMESFLKLSDVFNTFFDEERYDEINEALKKIEIGSKHLGTQVLSLIHEDRRHIPMYREIYEQVCALSDAELDYLETLIP